MLGKLLYNFIESPIIPLDFTSEQISSCKKYATDKFLSQYPSFSNKTIRNAISDDSKLQIVNLLSEYFDEGVQLLRNKQK